MLIIANNYMFIVLVTLSVYRNPRALEQLKRQPSTAAASFWVAPSVSVHHRISVLQSLGAQGVWIVGDQVCFNIVKESVQSSASHFPCQTGHTVGEMPK